MTFKQWWYDFKIKNPGRNPEERIAEAAWAASRMVLYENAAPSINEMVDRFLAWPLPKDFSPDCGISFKPPTTPHPVGYWPIGTNLLNADQARAMLEHVLDDKT